MSRDLDSIIDEALSVKEKKINITYKALMEMIAEESKIVLEQPGSQEETPVFTVPSPARTLPYQMTDEEMSNFLEKEYGEETTNEETKIREDKASIPKDAVLGYVCEVALQSAIVKNNSEAPSKISSIEEKDEAFAFFSEEIRNKPQILKKIEHRTVNKKKIEQTDAIGLAYVQNICKFYNESLKVTIETINAGSVKMCQNDKYVAVKLSDIIGDRILNTTAGGTAVYDVETESSNLHVKLNQSKPGKRLKGFQMPAKSEIIDLANTAVADLRQMKGSKFGITFSNKMQSSFGGLKSPGQEIMFQEIKGQLDTPEQEKNLIVEFMLKKTIASSGKISKPKGFSSKRRNLDFYDNAITIKGQSYPLEIDWDRWFPEIKKSYKRTIKRLFPKILPTDSSWKFILEDIKAKLVGEPEFVNGKRVGKTVLFFNYTGSLGSANLEVNKYQIENCESNTTPELSLEWRGLNPDSKRQPYGIIYIPQSKNKPLFEIEIRTDGEGHPPQLKIGRGLKNEKNVASYIYKQDQKNS